MGCKYWTLRLLGVLVPGVAGIRSPGSPESPGSLHSASWDDEVHCKDKKVVVIGNGSRGVQIWDDIA